jgi:hypothetical protein
MIQFRFMLRVTAFLVAVVMGGCSLIVDFDRGRIDPGTDAGVDAGPDGAVEAEQNAEAGASSDAD